MNDQKIYELIAKHDRVRAVQIADWLDADLSDVSQALRSLVDIGDVDQHKDIAPNGQPSMFYELSADFKASRTGREILGRLTAAPVPAPAPAAEPGPPEAQEAPQGEPATGTYAERAVAYIAKHGDTPDEVMRMALGLAKGHYPVSYLGAPIRAGKIRKDGGIWRLGTGATPFNPPVAPAKGGPVAKFDAKAPLEYPAGTEKPAEAPKRTAGVFDALVKGLGEKPAEPADAPVSLVASRPPAAAQAPAPAAAPVPPVAVAAPFDPAKLKVDPAPAPVDVPVFVPPAAPEPVYRAALWSDGIIELQRNGRTVAQVTQNEGEFLAEFIGRTLGVVSKVAA